MVCVFDLLIVLGRVSDPAERRSILERGLEETLALALTAERPPSRISSIARYRPSTSTPTKRVRIDDVTQLATDRGRYLVLELRRLEGRAPALGDELGLLAEAVDDPSRR